MSPLLLLLWNLAHALSPDEGALELTALIARHWESIREESVWQSPTVFEREHFREGLQQLVFASEQCNAARIEQARGLLQEAGFSVSREQIRDIEVLVVSEVAGHRRGGGMYVIRCGPAAPVVIQAPHAIFDRHTRDIAWAMFAEGDFRMGMWGTVHRYRSRPDETREEDIHPADVCHEFGSFYQAATVAAATALDALRFVQLHGFAAGRVQEDIVLSLGSPTRPPQALGQRLGDALGPAALFGEDVNTLGGTKNVQGRFLSSISEDRFLHLEMSPSTRDRLKTSAADRRILLQALEGPWR